MPISVGDFLFNAIFFPTNLTIGLAQWFSGSSGKNLISAEAKPITVRISSIVSTVLSNMNSIFNPLSRVNAMIDMIYFR
jgi:hypothetical protein